MRHTRPHPERRRQAQRWRRFTGYQIRNGYIRSAPDARLEAVDPWEEFWRARELSKRELQPPYLSLCRLAAQISRNEAESSDDHGGVIEEWSRRYGLLGLLLQNVEAVMFAPRVGQLRRSWREEFDVPSNEVVFQERWTRATGRWRSSFVFASPDGTGRIADYDWGPTRDDRENSVFVGVEAVKSRRRIPAWWPITDSVVVRTETNDLDVRLLKDAWLPFFPGVTADKLPFPGSVAFWKSYAEPVTEFVSAAKSFRSTVESFQVVRSGLLSSRRIHEAAPVFEGQQHLNTLLSTVSPVVDTSRERPWRELYAAPSLLGVFAAMLSLDLTETRRPRQCLGCDRLFISTVRGELYCSMSCRYRVVKRRVRQNQKRNLKEPRHLPS